jgi:hypothetical protein
MYIPAKIGPVVLDGGASGTGENSAGRMVARPKTAARRGATVRSSNLGRQYFVYIYEKKNKVWSNEAARPAEYYYRRLLVIPWSTVVI